MPPIRTASTPLAAACIACVLAACASAPATRPAAETADERGSPSTAQRAVAHVAGASGSLVSGTLVLTPMQGGVRIGGDIGGLAPGSAHGFHIHQTGDCSAADASSAGAHFNPRNRAHGNPAARMHHLGDADNVIADADGVAHVDTMVRGVSLGGGAIDDVAGRAIVVHAAPDDFRTQPSGNSGARIGCGVIVLQQP